MIHVDRSQVAIPDVLRMDQSSLALREKVKAEKVFEKAVTTLPSSRTRDLFRAYLHPTVREALFKLFHGKCAYCEQRVDGVTMLDRELFRPCSSVMESKDHPGYWWLAMVWDNMLVTCQSCNRSSVQDGVRSGKANRFPIADESKRAFRPGEETAEDPLLLDPCTDYPEEHLVFDVNGMVYSETPRGQATISVLGLNRKSLVEARRNAAAKIALIRKQADSALNPLEFEPYIGELREEVLDSSEYAAMKRQLLKDFFEKSAEFALPDLESVQATPNISKATKSRAKRAFKNYQKVQSTYTLATEEGKQRYREQRRLVEHITIENVRAITRIDLTVPEATRTPWVMLLGENGVGKSTLLQTLALTLLGAEAFINLARSIELRPDDFIRRTKDENPESGTVSVKLSGFAGPHELTFHSDHVAFKSPTGEEATIRFSGDEPEPEGAGWEPQVLLLGYGATRLMPNASRRLKNEVDRFSEHSRVDNMFDPFVPLADAEAWLAELPDPEFPAIANILASLMPLRPHEWVGRDKKSKAPRVYSGTSDRVGIPLRKLSDGFQSVIAMAVDIMQAALGIWPNLAEAEGIVLLDEVGAHLHPTWKMTVVAALRRAFPAMQFISSTHDPLCLRGLGAGEVVVMQRDEAGDSVIIDGLPSPGDFRVEQLLTSDFFGLNSLSDPETEREFDEFYALKAMAKRSKAEQERFEILSKQVENRQHLGRTPSEGLALQAIDQLLAEKKPKERIPDEALKQEAVDAIAKIWSETSA